MELPVKALRELIDSYFFQSGVMTALESKVSFLCNHAGSIEQGIREGHSDIAEALAKAYKERTFVDKLIKQRPLACGWIMQSTCHKKGKNTW